MTAAGAWIEQDGFLLEPRLRALGLKHGFTTRRLGSMKESSQRDAASAVLELPNPLLLKQVHGITIHRAAHSAHGLDGDGWTMGPGDEGLCVAVFVADCMPLYLWTDDGKYAGVFHAGWKGMAAGMPKANSKPPLSAWDAAMSRSPSGPTAPPRARRAAPFIW